LGFVISLAAGVVIYCLNKKRILNILFGCTCFFVSLWSLSEFMYRQAESYATASYWIKVRALAWTYPLAFLFHFLLIYTKKTKWLKARLEEKLLMFSCRTRGFCPSGHAKRLEQWGDWMRETLLLDVPHRQVVFTIPKMLRIFFKYNRRLYQILLFIGLKSQVRSWIISSINLRFASSLSWTPK